LSQRSQEIKTQLKEFDAGDIRIIERDRAEETKCLEKKAAKAADNTVSNDVSIRLFDNARSES